MKKHKYAAQVAILKAAKESIRNHSYTFICYAIEGSKTGTTKQQDQLVLWVEKLLDGYPSYGVWVYQRYPALFSDYRDRVGYEGRLQWLDWMIKHWETKK